MKHLPAYLRLSALQAYVPGLLICVVIAFSATFLAEHYGGPQLLYALLIGLSLHSLTVQRNLQLGIQFCAKTVLRIGVALLGIRITLNQVGALGIELGLVLVLAVAITIGVGIVLAHCLKRPLAQGVLTGGAVGICGASAAMAIASVLPQTQENEHFTLLTVVGVTVLSTLAMVLYPFLLPFLGLSPIQSGIFLGGTIHDVAQVVAAGMMVGPAAGDTATVVKLFRVVLLMPVVVLIAFAYRTKTSAQPLTQTAPKPPWIPAFLIGFLALMLMTSTGLIPASTITQVSDISRWSLIIAISAAGIKTNLNDLKKLGWQPVAMLLTETLAIAGCVLVFILFVKS